jgi:transcription termination/antitermination protein NusA
MENYAPGERIKVFVKGVNLGVRGPQVVVSRASEEMVRKLFTLEIPEVASGTVVIHNVAREAGSRSKVSVSSSQANIDPIGSCIGQRGTRIQTIITELGGEKVDIIQHSDEADKYIAMALAPAKVAAVELNEAEKVASVTVPADQLSLAIGRGGQNVRLASSLTGWKINIKENGAAASEAAPLAEEAEAAPAAEEDKSETQ